MEQPDVETGAPLSSSAPGRRWNEGGPPQNSYQGGERGEERGG